ncbi:MAG: PepSY-like domain-containing protein, partial [Bacteroidaceae bacterium]|nr:PepSY-like domain-containing protein [Bacteroidaceae bacterium]
RLTVKENLPKKALLFIDSNFKDAKITYVKDERDYLERSYEVLFANGTKVEFNRNGEWKEVDCRREAVPSAIVPAKILNYVNSTYPGVKIVRIEHDRTDYELKLSNNLELTFNKKLNIIDIDD